MKNMPTKLDKTIRSALTVLNNNQYIERYEWCDDDEFYYAPFDELGVCLSYDHEKDNLVVSAYLDSDDEWLDELQIVLDGDTEQLPIERAILAIIGKWSHQAFKNDWDGKTGEETMREWV